MGRQTAFRHKKRKMPMQMYALGSKIGYTATRGLFLIEVSCVVNACGEKDDYEVISLDAIEIAQREKEGVPIKRRYRRAKNIILGLVRDNRTGEIFITDVQVKPVLDEHMDENFDFNFDRIARHVVLNHVKYECEKEQ